MRPRELPVALLALLAFVVVIPVWTHYLGSADLPAQAAWTAGLALPAGLALLVAGWIRPELARPLMGVFVFAGVMALAPELWAMVGLAAGRLADGSLAQAALTIALPVIFLVFILSAGWRRQGARP